MPLWNELEGTRIADRFPLKTLLRSEGRTAWFETERPSGGRAVISIAESMNDEAALLARLEAASRLKHPNLIEISETGSANAHDADANEDTPLVYGVMEPFDEGLADVLRERALTAEETGEIADSLLPALEAVHAAGLVHGRVEPASVLAAGETIKLRSDCLHTSGDDTARSEDVRGFAATLYQALTQRRPTGSVDTSRLPAPFASIIRNGLGGQWTLADVRRALKGPAVETAATAGGVAVRPSAAVPLPQAPAVPSPAVTTRPASGSSAPAAAASTPAKAMPTEERRAPVASPPIAGVAAGGVSGQASRPNLGDAATSPRSARRGRRLPVVAIAIAALVLIAVLWAVFHRHPAGTTNAGNGAPETVAPAGPPASTALPGGTSVRPSEAVSQSMGAPGATPAEPVRPTGLRGKPSAVTSSGAVVAGAAGVSGAHGPRDVWHVIVYTYDLQAKAQQKADQLAAQHADLSPQVFSPTGGKPFLVTLGGGMTREQALALRDKARGEGLPRDMYTQNWSK